MNKVFQRIEGYRQKYPYLRVGQVFCNLYMLKAWPELFHEVDEAKAKALITKWCEDNQYTDTPPPEVDFLHEVEDGDEETA